MPAPLRDLLSRVPPPSSLTFLFTGLIGADSYSGYTQATASLTNWLELTLGGR